MTKSTSELFEMISDGLRKGESESYSANAEWGLHKCDSDITDAQAALPDLMQRMKDLEAFYQHMIGDEYHDEYLASIEAAQSVAANFGNDDEYTQLGIDAQLFRDLMARLNEVQS